MLYPFKLIAKQLAGLYLNSLSTVSTIQGKESLYHGVQELLPDRPSDIEHSGKMSVLFKMLQHLHSMSREKIVVVSNFTQVCVCVCVCMCM